MQEDRPSQAGSKKRTSAWLDHDEVELNETPPPELDDAPSKRLLTNSGEVIETQKIIKYNAQKLLNHVAFTQVFVTANYHNYNPAESLIILCMVSAQNTMYQSLWSAIHANHFITFSLY